MMATKEMKKAMHSKFSGHQNDPEENNREHQRHIIRSGEGLTEKTTPAHAPNNVTPNGRFKMIQTIIKSEYE